LSEQRVGSVGEISTGCYLMHRLDGHLSVAFEERERERERETLDTFI
jgi:hypothetical protein